MPFSFSSAQLKFPLFNVVVFFYHFKFLTYVFNACRDGEAVAVVYFRAGYAPTDYPSELVSALAAVITLNFIFYEKFIVVCV